MRNMTLSLFLLAVFCAHSAYAESSPVTCREARDQFQFAKIIPMFGEDGQRPEGVPLKVDPRFAIAFNLQQAPSVISDANDKSVTRKLDKWASHVTVTAITIANDAVVNFLSPADCYF